MTFTPDELNRLRQWYNAVEDAAGQYLELADRVLMAKIYAELGPEWSAAAARHTRTIK